MSYFIVILLFFQNRFDSIYDSIKINGWIEIF